MLRASKSITKCAIVFFVLTLVNAFVWEYVAGDLYDCTDGGIPGYFEPGHWVYSWDGHSVAVVPHVVHGRSLSEPDTIKTGWSVASLLFVWFLFFGASLVVSILLPRVRWFPGSRPNLGAAPNGGPATQLGNSGVTEGRHR